MSKKLAEVPIILDKKRTLKFNMNALAAFEEVMGFTLTSFLLDISQASADDNGVARFVGLRHLRALLWAGLLHEDKRLSLEDAGELVDKADGADWNERFQYVLETVFKAFAAFQGSGDDGKKKQDSQT